MKIVFTVHVLLVATHASTDPYCNIMVCTTFSPHLFVLWYQPELHFVWFYRLYSLGFRGRKETEITEIETAFCLFTTVFSCFLFVNTTLYATMYMPLWSVEFN